jgi:hypothetical protein
MALGQGAGFGSTLSAYLAASAVQPSNPDETRNKLPGNGESWRFAFGLAVARQAMWYVKK